MSLVMQPKPAQQKAAPAVPLRRKKRSKSKALRVLTVLLVILIGGVMYLLRPASTAPETTNSLPSEDRKLFKAVADNIEYFKEVYDVYPDSYDILIEIEWMTEKPRDHLMNLIEYKRDPNGSTYTLRSAGKDLLMGTKDDACLRSVTKNNISLHFFTCPL